MEDVALRYLAAVWGPGRVGRDAVTPSVLASACLGVLPVDGAGISLAREDLRVPLAWSSDDVALAEQIQTTMGDGPCLTAAAEGSAFVADDDTLAERWPLYHGEFRDRTPFASVAAVPLARPGERAFAALNLYASRPDLSTVLPLLDATAVAAPMAAILLGLMKLDDDAGSATWLSGPAEDRILVWRAVGMVMAAAHTVGFGGDGDDHQVAQLDDGNALTLLRAYAYGHDVTLDHLARQILDQDLDPAAVLR